MPFDLRWSEFFIIPAPKSHTGAQSNTTSEKALLMLTQRWPTPTTASDNTNSTIWLAVRFSARNFLKKNDVRSQPDRGF
jgi:hypothetical protein